ncbi:MAG: TetR/AcrR family transcriptional regulator [Methylococcaceae bacterium]|nr:TetR/AcrR family transcriptional regulator [Methylococcaceae bacterium]
MPPKLKSPADREKLRASILDAARTLFVERGIEAVSMREIAKQINYSATTLYNHFADKEALLQAVCDADFLALASGMREIMSIPNLVTRLQALSSGYAQFALQHPNHYRLMFMTPRAPCNLDITEIEQGNTEQDAYAQLKLIVQEAFAAGLFKAELKDYELIAQTVWASVHGVCSLEIAMGHETKINWGDISARLNLMQTAMLRGLLRDPENHVLNSTVPV